MVHWNAGFFFPSFSSVSPGTSVLLLKEALALQLALRKIVSGDNRILDTFDPRHNPERVKISGTEE